MTTGTWDPQAETTNSPIELSAELLASLASHSEDGQLEDLQARLGAAEQQRLAGLMQIDHETWRSAAEALPDEQILHLVRFFAVAENLPGWEAGAKSPVIPLAKVLRKRGQRLERDLLQWLREVNENRFLPYGPL